jgi:hypothetical protein
MTVSRSICAIAAALVCAAAPLYGQDQYSIVDTNIVISHGANVYRWCGNDHVLVAGVIGVSSQGPARLLDVKTMREVPLALVDDKGRKLLPDVRTCGEREFIAWRAGDAAPSNPDPTRDIYKVAMGQPGALIASIVDTAVVSLRGGYLIANTPRRLVDGDYRVEQQCSTYHAPGFEVLCWDTDLRRIFPLARFAVAEYTWQEYITAAAENGQRRPVKNREPPLLLEDGKPVRSAYLLRNLRGQILANLSEEGRYRVNGLFFAFSPDERYVYSPCKESGEREIELDRVCRYLIDGAKHAWELVFRFNGARDQKASISDIDVGGNGDVYFTIPAARSANVRGIWRYEASTGNVHLIARPPNGGRGDERPRVSPDGRKVVFGRPAREFTLHVGERG